MSWLNYHHLLYFWTVAREGSIARACEKLRLAQPTISGQLRMLLINEVEVDPTRLLRVLHGKDVTDGQGDGQFRLDEDEAEHAYRLTTEVVARVIQFLKNDVGIPHYELLPYKQPIVTLGKFFHHHPTPGPRSRNLLVRWVWRGALNGAHRGDTVSTRKSLERIVLDDEEASVQRMLDMVSGHPAL